MAVTANPHATHAAEEVLRDGGNALDAAIAAQMVLNVVEPQSSGIGGGGFLVYYRAADRTVTTYDGRETAPGQAKPDQFLGPDGQPLAFFDAVVGGRSVGVPGLVAMLALAHGDQGKRPWADLLAPAIDLARNGFAVSERLASLIANDRYLATFSATRNLFFSADGRALREGDLFRNPALAGTLHRLAKEGSGAFYSGPLADAVAATVRSAPLAPGWMTASDLAGYRALRRPALCGPYRNWTVCGMGPPSSGAATVLQQLALLDGFDLSALGPNNPAALHLIAEAGRLSFADRNAYLADADWVSVPLPGLLDRRYLDDRRRLIDPERAGGTAAPGFPPGQNARWIEGQGPEGLSTTHISIVDSEGNAVSLTSSIETAFGSRLSVGGFLLNNQLTDFSFRPEIDGRAVANRLQPGKRPRSSMAPTLVLDRDGRLVAVLGSPGGSRIIGYVTGALIALLDWNLDPAEAAALGHALNRNGRTELEAETGRALMAADLERLGHDVRVTDMTSGLAIIRRENGRWLGAADPRREGLALGR